MQAEIGGGASPHVVWSIAGSGTHERFTLAELKGAGLDVEVHGTGELRWRPQMVSALAWLADGLIPAAQRPALPGAVHITGSVLAAMPDGKPDFTLDLSDVHGELFEHAFTGVASARMQGERSELSQF